MSRHAWCASPSCDTPPTRVVTLYGAALEGLDEQLVDVDGCVRLDLCVAHAEQLATVHA